MGLLTRLSLKSRSLRLASGVVFLVGGGIFLSSGLLWRENATIAIYTPNASQMAIERLSMPTRIAVGSLISLPVVETQFESTGWQVSDTAASIASTSARPGENGNIVIYSHNKKKLFGPLHQVRTSDQITITTEDGKEHTYTVTSSTVVNPDQIDLLRPTETEVLTLYTCTGFLDSKRLVIRAIPL